MDVSEAIQKCLDEIATKGLLKNEEIKEKILPCVTKLSENEVLHILESFQSTDLKDVEDKAKYLYDLFSDHIRSGSSPKDPIVYLANNIIDISNKESILELLKRTKYTLTLSVSQRRYGGPPPGWEGPEPSFSDPKQCVQVHIGRLGRKVFEDTLVPLIESCGRIYQLRIMINSNNGYNKGYAFVDFFTPEEALNFIEKYNRKVIIPNEPPITVKQSMPNCRLFVPGIPPFKSKKEVEEEVKKQVETAKDVVAFHSSSSIKRNRGFVFIDFKNHNDANQARKKLQKGLISIFNQTLPDVEWAELPQHVTNELFKLNTLHIRFIPQNVTTEKLKEIFTKFGNVVKFDRLTEYAFAEFETEEEAKEALKATEDSTIDGVKLIVGYAKSNKNKQQKMLKDRQTRYDYRHSPDRTVGKSRNRYGPNTRDSSYHREPSQDYYYRNYNAYPSQYMPPPPQQDMYAPRPPVYDVSMGIGTPGLISDPKYMRGYLPPNYPPPNYPPPNFLPPRPVYAPDMPGNVRTTNWSQPPTSVFDPFFPTYTQANYLAPTPHMPIATTQPSTGVSTTKVEFTSFPSFVNPHNFPHWR